eukprot:3005544-Heterocapsa_arctica.AAC.1
MESKWRVTRFVGCSLRANEMLMMTMDGVERARTVRRMPEPDRWATDDWDRLAGTPWQPRPGAE